MNYKKVQELLEEYQLSPDKNFGQNFLIDDNITKVIAEKAKNKNVIEVGPGLGSLTEYLAFNANKLLCYEIDKGMAKVITEKIINNNNNVKLIVGDFLKQDLKQDIKEYFNNENVEVFANLPYYITTAILIKILEEAPLVKSLTIMMQKEVADRLGGKPKTKDYNSLSVLLQYYTKIKKVLNVPSSSFYPTPKVESVVLNIERVEPLKRADNEEYFLKFNRAIFMLRRKTLVNNLNAFFGYNKSEIIELLKKHNYKETLRAEELNINEIIELSNIFYKSF